MENNPLPQLPASLTGDAPEPLSAVLGTIDKQDRSKLLLEFNRDLTDEEARAIVQLPPSPLLADDLNVLLVRVQLLEIAVRLYRVHVLSGVVTSEGPGFSRWLRDWIDGTNHGPLGGPMLWPNGLPATATLLRQWGFGPVLHEGRAYVARVGPPEGNEGEAS